MSDETKATRSFTLDHLSSVDFEQLCYDLLVELGCVNVNWRKGTGLASSPADQGRDIQCQREVVDIDGGKYLETVFVECKHWEKGVPPSELDGVLAWATAEAADVVLIIVSNFLSNSAKEYLESYKRSNRPRFRINVWERPNLERLTLGHSQLLRKYDISGEFPALALMHPAHILYTTEMPFNRLDSFFDVLDGLEPEQRDNVLGWAYSIIIRPRRAYRTETIWGRAARVPDKSLDELSYEAFKSKCYEIAAANVLYEELLVFLIVNWVLQHMFSIADTTSIDTKAEEIRKPGEFLRRIMEDRPEDQELRAFLEQRGEDFSDHDAVEKVIAFGERMSQSLRGRTERNYELYEYFCENVLRQLLLNDASLRSWPAGDGFS